MSEFPEKIQEIVVNPSAEHLLTVGEDDNRKLLYEDRATAFHHLVMQLLFATTRVRKFIQKYVALLITRARSPDEDDWRKL